MIIAKTLTAAVLMLLCLLVSLGGIVFGAIAQVFELLSEMGDEFSFYLIELCRRLDQ